MKRFLKNNFLLVLLFCLFTYVYGDLFHNKVLDDLNDLTKLHNYASCLLAFVGLIFSASSFIIFKLKEVYESKRYIEFYKINRDKYYEGRHLYEPLIKMHKEFKLTILSCLWATLFVFAQPYFLYLVKNLINNESVVFKLITVLFYSITATLFSFVILKAIRSIKITLDNLKIIINFWKKDYDDHN